ncbi:MAG: HlyD family efflux transporter periplasmic adaptor subunit [Lachnospiraceae bacterium]|nr:HlyD family efflux transporter periplasmic adaptor subunit [Lachnospiraceae bacterium]
MNENGTKKREWVKNAAIVFLIILLLLTFFSNTIQNYSLPEVATQYVESGSITAKIRGTGQVESGDPYNVKIKETREVASVEVKVGDKVEAGQVLCYLTEGDSTDLETAKTTLEQNQKALEDAQSAFELKLLTGDYDISIMQSAGNTQSTSSYLEQIYALKNAITAAEKERDAAQVKVDEWTAWIAALDRQISITPSNNADVTQETAAVNNAQSALNTINNDLTTAKNWLTSLDAQIAQEKEVIAVSGGDSSVLDSLNAQRLTANQNVINLESQQRTAQQNLDAAQAALDAKKASGDTSGTISNLNGQKANAQLEQAKANDELAKKEAALAEQNEKYTELIKNIGDAFGLSTAKDAITDAQEAVNKAQEEVDKLTAGAMGTEVTAPISGLITSVNVKSGLETPTDGIVFTMQPEGKGYTMSFTVTNQQAQRLSVGDQAELVNAWRYDDINVVLSSIKPDPNNPGQNKLLTFDVSGESVVAGQTLNVSVGQKSANYDMTVPNSAIREDSNGKFILIVESKSSPIGTRYFATRVDVEVLASDDTRSAISGGLYGYEYAITTSTKPVEAGKQVRLANN